MLKQVGIGRFVLILLFVSIGFSSKVFPEAPDPSQTRSLTVVSSNASGGAFITVSPFDNNGTIGSTTPSTLTYNNNMVVTLTAAGTAGGNNFSSWSGCDS